MRIVFKDILQPVKTLIIEGEEYKFTDLLMSNDYPVWKVKLENGNQLILYFSKQDTTK